LILQRRRAREDETASARSCDRWHDLRHTSAALSLAASPSLAVVKERRGHEDVQTTVDLYGKLVPSVDAALADVVGASIFAAPDNVTPLRAAEDA
jgi:integrase